MSLASTLNFFRPTLPSYVNLAKYDLIQVHRDNFHLNLNPKAPALAQEMAKAMFAMGGPENSLAMTAEEHALGTAICKLALNVCLLATTYGVRCLGAENPSHHRRLEHFAQVARKKGRERKEVADIDLLTHPMRFAFAEDVVVFQRESGDGERNGVGGWTVTPHWRRGHWRQQPCGPGRSERRRIAIPSVLVNGHLFFGSPADTLATYKVRG